MREPHLAVLLVCYAFASFCYSALCGHLGRSAHPLGAYQVYAVACGVWFAMHRTRQGVVFPAYRDQRAIVMASSPHTRHHRQDRAGDR